MTTTTTMIATPEDILTSVSQLSEPAKRAVAVEILRQFSSKTILEILQQTTPADAKEVIYKLPEPVTDEEKEMKALLLALGIDPERDDNPGVQALNRLGGALRDAGVTYEDLMAEIKIQREKTIRQYFPSLIPLLDEVSPDAKTVS